MALKDYLAQQGLATPPQVGGGFRLGAPSLTPPTPATPQRGIVGRSLQGVSSILEPLTLPQNVLFAAIAGNLDDETNFTERFKGNEGFWETLARYAPGGAAPNRPSSGSEILQMFGVEDEGARKWGGIGLDLAADPLLIGGYFSAAGKLGKLAGLSDDASQQLIRMGRGIEKATSPAGMYQAIPKNMRRGLDSRVEQTFKAAVNSKVFWAENSKEALTYGDWTLARRTALKAQMPQVTSRGISFGERVAQAQGVATGTAVDVQNRVMDLTGEAAAQVMSFQEQVDFLGKGMGIVKKQAQAAGVTGDLPQVVQSFILKNGWNVADSNGVLSFDPGALKSPEIKSIFSTAGRGAQRTTPPAADFNTYLKNVELVARKAGMTNPQEAVERARTFVHKVVEADALAGYHNSGYEFIKRKFYEAGMGKGLLDTDLDNLWGRAINLASSDPKAVLDMDTGLAANLLPGGMTTNYTMKDLLDGVETFSAVHLGDYMKSLTAGHMRATYGVTQDAGSFERYRGAVEEGRVFLNNVINNGEIARTLGPGFSQEATLLEEFRNLMETSVASGNKRAKAGAKAGVATSTNLLYNKYEMFQHLVDNGIAPTRARDALTELAKVSNPQMERTLSNLQDVSDAFSQIDKTQGVNTFGTTFSKQRNANLTVEQREVLGELFNPLVSVTESAGAARAKVPFVQSMSELYTDGRAMGLVRDAAFVDPTTKTRYIKIPKEKVSQWGAYADKYVHPMLYKELNYAMQHRGGGGALSRIRGLVSGAYLMKPSVMVANLAGGIFQSAAAGVSPDRMVQSMFKTFVPLLKHDKGLAEMQHVKTLNRYFDLTDSTLIQRDAMKNFDKMAQKIAGIEGQGLGEKISAMGDFLHKQLAAPGVGRFRAGALGLDGFQFVERWLKVSAYDAEYARLLKAGSKPAEAERLAAEVGRIAVNDYSELPMALQVARDSGVMLFPGFTYFMAARTLNATLNRPGVLATADRLSDAVNNAVLDPDEKLAMMANLPEWLADEQGVAIRKDTDEKGDTRVSVIPFNHLVPTNFLTGNPWGESLATLGIYKPFQEVLNAMITGDGRAVFSERYGQKVFDPGSSKPVQALQTAEFLLSSLAPSSVRSLGLDPQSIRKNLSDPSAEPAGITGALFKKNSLPLDEGLAQTMYSISERVRLKPDRDIKDQAIAALLRSPQRIALSGPLKNVNRVIEGMKRDLAAEVASDKEKLKIAIASGNKTAAEKLRARILAKQERAVGRMKEIVSLYQASRD